jgi:hypothetical protein
MQGYSIKKPADILKYFEDAFWGWNTAGSVLSGLAADRLWEMRVSHPGKW